MRWVSNEERFETWSLREDMTAEEWLHAMTPEYIRHWQSFGYTKQIVFRFVHTENIGYIIILARNGKDEWKFSLYCSDQTVDENFEADHDREWSAQTYRDFLAQLPKYPGSKVNTIGA